MKVTFNKMCDRCLRQLGDSEVMYGFKFIDDLDVEKVFKGHEECINEVLEIMTQLYGVKEQNEDDNK